jgi:hypothetical protein
MERFILQESREKENHWVCTDRMHNIVCVFCNHKFNDTQKFTLLDGDRFKTEEEALSVATYLREMSDWLRENHYDKVF